MVQIPAYYKSHEETKGHATVMTGENTYMPERKLPKPKRCPKSPKRQATPHFADYPHFKPNLSPFQIFQLGSFGGTYWRPIASAITGESYAKQHLEFGWTGIGAAYLHNTNCVRSINKYGVTVGTGLDAWESKGWITSQDPYGWVQWYCRFYAGRRSADDARQIGRWMGIASERGRFRRWLVTLLLQKGGKWNDETISPKIRQTLQHWGYQLTLKDFNKDRASRGKGGRGTPERNHPKMK